MIFYKYNSFISYEEFFKINDHINARIRHLIQLDKQLKDFFSPYFMIMKKSKDTYYFEGYFMSPTKLYLKIKLSDLGYAKLDNVHPLDVMANAKFIDLFLLKTLHDCMKRELGK